jgi:pimeloyl-ACP methyl ester carboxylesterase
MHCTIRDLDVYYETYGAGQAILMIHGYRIDHRVLSTSLEPLFNERGGYQRIYLNLPGMGQTPSGEWLENSDVMLDVVCEFIERVIPNQNFLVVGQSYGGYLARGLLHRKFEAIDGLMLLVPVIQPRGEDRKVPPQFTLIRDEAALDTLNPMMRQIFENMCVIQTPELIAKTAAVAQGMTLSDHEFLNAFQQDSTRYRLSFDVDDLREPFEMPMLTLSGRHDNNVGYPNTYTFLDNFPRGTVAVLDRAGHNLPLEQETLFNALVHEWLDRVEEAIAMKSPERAAVG